MGIYEFARDKKREVWREMGKIMEGFSDIPGFEFSLELADRTTHALKKLQPDWKGESPAG